jgi:hypothetical protein
MQSKETAKEKTKEETKGGKTPFTNRAWALGIPGLPE